MVTNQDAEKQGMVFWFVFYGIGLVGTLVIYGLLQERIMTVPYDGEFFRYSAFLVFANRVFNSAYASSMIAFNGESFYNKAPFWKYMIVSLSNVAASVCQYEALKYVSFPVQMLGKSFKMMPVMLWGIVISHKKYRADDWLIATAVTGGVTVFLLTGNISSKHAAETHDSFWGLGLLLAFLAFDGLTSTMQEKLFKEHDTSKFNQMFYVNGVSGCTSLISLLAAGTLGPSITFGLDHSAFVRDTVLLSLTASSSQYFIYSQVKEFGALVFAATMNVRQVVSILLSYVTYGHLITTLQMGGLLLVFMALFYKSYIGMSSASAKEESTYLLAKKADAKAEAAPSASQSSQPSQVVGCHSQLPALPGRVLEASGGSSTRT